MERPLRFLNKLSEEQGILRQTMLFSGLEVCAHNINRKQKDLRLFEFGKVYGMTSAVDGKKKYHEKKNGWHFSLREMPAETGKLAAQNQSGEVL